MSSKRVECDELRGELQKAIAYGIPMIQQAFDAYQRAGFVERPPEFFALELCGEAGELANLEKKRWRGSGVSYEDTADEAADVFIALINFCNARNVNLDEAVRAKLNRIRPNKE